MPPFLQIAEIRDAVKIIFYLVDFLTGVMIDRSGTVCYINDMKNPHAQALGRLGGLARAKTLSDEQRLEASHHANEMKRKRAMMRRALNEPQPSESIQKGTYD